MKKKILIIVLSIALVAGGTTGIIVATRHKHNYNSVITKPTCTEQGYTTYTCIACDYSYVDDYVSAIGHNYKKGNCINCEETSIDYFDFYLLDDDTYEITVKYSCLRLPTQVVIPTLYNSRAVTSIGSEAFEDCSSLTSVEIGDSVTSIGSSAFYGCSSLISVVIGDSVTSIGDYVFEYCSSLTNITVSEDNERYKDIDGNLYSKDGTILIQYAIGKTDTSFTIPNSVTSIGSCAFYYCDSLTSVVIPDSVTSIGDSAFYRCSSLNSVVIGDSVTSIGEDAFEDCRSLINITVNKDNERYKDIDGNLYSKDGTILIQYAMGKTDTLFTIPSSVTSIGDYAFRECSSLTSVVIGDSVTSIGDYAFEDCSSLTSVLIGDSITTISANSFSGCSALQFNRYENCKYLGNEQNPYLLLLKAINNLTTYIINNDTKVIAEGAFAGHSKLTSIEIPSSVTSIHNEAFSGCSSLISIEVSEDNTNFKDIDGNLYSKDGSILIQYAIGKIDVFFAIPNSVTHISDKAFYKCNSLISVEIPDSVTSIGEKAFYDCVSLISIAIADSLTSIGDMAFYNCSSLTSIVIPNLVVSIGDYAFAHCYSLTSIVIPNSVVSIGDVPFLSCKSLANIEVSKDNANYKDIDGNLYTKDGTVLIQYAIGKTESLFIIPDCVITIGDAFDYCESLTSVVIPHGVTSISYFAFNYCNNLTSIVIPNSVNSIGRFAFARCSSLTSIKYSGTQAEWNAILKEYFWDLEIGNYIITYNYTGEQ